MHGLSERMAQSHRRSRVGAFEPLSAGHIRPRTDQVPFSAAGIGKKSHITDRVGLKCLIKRQFGAIFDLKALLRRGTIFVIKIWSETQQDDGLQTASRARFDWEN